jgi:hypothetical protein
MSISASARSSSPPTAPAPHNGCVISGATGSVRQYRVKYRRPFGTEWEDLDLDRAMDMIADRVIESRRRASARDAKYTVVPQWARVRRQEDEARDAPSAR